MYVAPQSPLHPLCASYSCTRWPLFDALVACLCNGHPFSYPSTNMLICVTAIYLFAIGDFEYGCVFLYLSLATTYALTSYSGTVPKMHLTHIGALPPLLLCLQNWCHRRKQAHSLWNSLMCMQCLHLHIALCSVWGTTAHWCGAHWAGCLQLFLFLFLRCVPVCHFP